MVAGVEDTGAGGGWSWVLSDLKTLLETGSSLGLAGGSPQPGMRRSPWTNTRRRLCAGRLLPVASSGKAACFGCRGCLPKEKSVNPSNQRPGELFAATWKPIVSGCGST